MQSPHLLKVCISVAALSSPTSSCQGPYTGSCLDTARCRLLLASETGSIRAVTIKTRYPRICRDTMGAGATILWPFSLPCPTPSVRETVSTPLLHTTMLPFPSLLSNHAPFADARNSAIVKAFLSNAEMKFGTIQLNTVSDICSVLRRK